MKRLNSVHDLIALRKVLSSEGVLAPDKKRVKVGCGLPCSTLGAHEVARGLEDEASRSGIQLEVVKTGCQGLCQRGPLVKVEPHGYFYQRVTPEKAKEIISTTYSTGLPVRALPLSTPLELRGAVLT